MTLKKYFLNAPVLFLIFNRLDTTKKVFREIRKAKPKQLFIASDGPRQNKKGEEEIVEKVRKYILAHIDWPCKVKKLFRKNNLGCKYAVSGAIDWFFDNVDQGIILEDDCLPDQSFFRFCEELLEKYKTNKKIMSVCGTNLAKEFSEKKLKESYYFSKTVRIWGWATWRRVWKNYDVEAHAKSKFSTIFRNSSNPLELISNIKQFKSSKNKNMDTWDTQLNILIQNNKGLNIIPKNNIVKNLGFNLDSTHTKENYWDKKFLNLEREHISFPLVHPKKIKVNQKLENSFLKRDLKRILSKKLKLRRKHF